MFPLLSVINIFGKREIGLWLVITDQSPCVSSGVTLDTSNFFRENPCAKDLIILCNINDLLYLVQFV